MKIVFHERYFNSSYAMDPAASPGRLEGIIELLSSNKEYEFITPKPASKDDILRAHSERHYNYVKSIALLFELLKKLIVVILLLRLSDLQDITRLLIRVGVFAISITLV